MHRLLTPLVLPALALCAPFAVAAPFLELKPGTWQMDSEIWINGRSMKPALEALRANVRNQVSQEQQQEMARQDAASKHACITPQMARIDLPRYLEKALSDTGGAWQCDTTADKMDGSAASGSYRCRTAGGGLSQGKFSATYSATEYKLELNGRGNVVAGPSGAAIAGTEMDQRMLSTGRWIAGSC